MEREEPPRFGYPRLGLLFGREGIKLDRKKLCGLYKERRLSQVREWDLFLMHDIKMRLHENIRLLKHPISPTRLVVELPCRVEEDILMVDRCSSRRGDGGPLAITIRPIEYWSVHQGLSVQEIAVLETAHRTRGFAFRPHNRVPIDGDITYGDASTSLEYVVENIQS